MPGEYEPRSAAPVHATGAVEFVALEDVAGDETFRLRPDGDVADLATSLGRLGQLAPVELRPWPGAGSDGPRWQVVAGFRRLAATRLLARDRVLARLHGSLSDEDAWGLALAEALLHEPLGGDELSALAERLRATGVAPWAEELVDEARVRAPVPAELRERFLEFLEQPTTATPTATATETATPTEDETDAEPGRQPLALSVAPDEGRAVPDDGRGVEGRGEADTVEVTPEELVADLAARLSALNQDLATAVEAWEDLPLEGRRLLLEQARYVAALLPFMEAE